MCYVGKATKIFFVLVGALMVVGLVVGLGLVRHGWAHKAAARPCQSSAGCHPMFPDPIPADAGATAGASSPPVPAAIPANAFDSPPLNITVAAPPPSSLPTTLPPPSVAPPPSSLPTTLPPPSVAPPPASSMPPPSVTPPPAPPMPPQPPTLATDIPTPTAATAAPPLVSPGPPSPASEPLGPARA